MKKIAILVNCRVEGNPNSNLQKLIDTLNNYSTYPDRIELRVKFDTDDSLAPTLLKNLVRGNIDFEYIVEPRGRGYVDIHHGYNRLLTTITKDVELIVAMADDFKVDLGWDEALWKKYGEAAGQYMIIHQRGHPPSDRPDFGTRPFKPPEEIFTKGEDLFVVDEAPCWSRALVFASTWLGAGLSFTDGWTLALEYELWKNHGISITQFTDKQYIHRKVHPVVDTAQGARWKNDRLVNFDYMRSAYFKEIVNNQAINIAERVLSCGKTNSQKMPAHSHGDATFAAGQQTTVSTESQSASDTGKPISTANPEKLFSIVFPTRERTALLDGLLKSIELHTKRPEVVEVLVAYDDDDEKTMQYIKDHKRGTIDTIWVKCKRSLNFSRDYYSYLATLAIGKWIVVINDDTEFRTQDWDEKAEGALRAAIGDGPNVIYGWVEDNLGRARAMQFNNYTCFPILGRAGIDALGYVFPERIPLWGADIWCRYLYGHVKRVAEVPITIAHICHHNGTRPQDHINKRIQANTPPVPMTPTAEEINKLLRILNPGPPGRK